MPTTIFVFYGSLFCLAGLFSVSFLERSRGRRIIFARLRQGVDPHIMAVADRSFHMVLKVWHVVAVATARFLRWMLSGTIIRFRRISAGLRDIAERRKAVPKERGSMSKFLKIIIDHKHALHSSDESALK